MFREHRGNKKSTAHFIPRYALRHPPTDFNTPLLWLPIMNDVTINKMYRSINLVPRALSLPPSFPGSSLPPSREEERTLGTRLS